jgi:hypothetical protein
VLSTNPFINGNAWFRASEQTDPARVTPKKKRRDVQLQSGRPAFVLFAGQRMGACVASSGCSSGCMWRLKNRERAWPWREAPSCVRCWLDQPARPLAAHAQGHMPPFRACPLLPSAQACCCLPSCSFLSVCCLRLGQVVPFCMLPAALLLWSAGLASYKAGQTAYLFVGGVQAHICMRCLLLPWRLTVGNWVPS